MARTALFARHQPGGVFTIEDVPDHPGAVFFVDSTHADKSDAAGGGKSPDKPLATLDYAVGLCAANKGDVIYVMPGHAETISGAAGVNLDQAGITVIGLGNGPDRPTFSFSAVASTIAVAAAGIRLVNLVFESDAASTIMLDVNADDCVVERCEFREGDSQAVTYLDVNGGGANAADRFALLNSLVYSPTAGATQGVEIGAVQDRVRLVGNVIQGDFSVAGVHSGSICTRMLIGHNIIENVNAADFCIELTAAATGMLVGNRFYADAAATTLDPGSLKCVDNFMVNGIDAGGTLVPAAISDSAANALGADSADNSFASTNVVANADGSVLERQEWVQAQVGALVNTDGTATLGGIIGDLANDSLVARLNDVGSNVDSATTDNLQGKVGTDAELADRSLYDLLNGGGPAAAAAAAAPANDVSLYAVLRAIYDRQLGDGTNAATNSRLGKRVTKAAADLLDSVQNAMFTIAGGRVLLTSLSGEVSGAAVDAGANATKWISNPTVGTDMDLCATLDITGDELGTLYSISGIVTDAMTGGSGGGAMAMQRPIILAEGTIDIKSAADGGVGGALLGGECWYLPLDNGATIAAA